MIPPYGLEKEEWDNKPWGTEEFDLVFKKIGATDSRRLIFVVCFGITTILADFIRSAKVFLFLFLIIN